jgi:hypothetical protein
MGKKEGSIVKLRMLVIILAVCGAAAASALPGTAVSAQLLTGAQDVVSVSGAAVTDAVSLHDAETGLPSRFRVDLSFASLEQSWGITTRMEAQTLGSPGFQTLWTRALVWGNLLENLMTVKAGLLDETAFSFTWRPWGSEIIWGSQSDGRLGLELQARPISGLSLGWVYPILTSSTALDCLSASYLAAAYEREGLGRVVGGLQLAKAANSTYAWLGADLTMLKDLSARVAAQAFYIGDATYFWLELYQEAGYSLDSLGFSVKAWEEVYARAGSSLAWQVEPAVSYAAAPFQLGVFGDAGTLLALDPNPGVAALPFGLAAGAWASLALAPSALIKLGGRWVLPDLAAAASTVQVFITFSWQVL